MTEVALPAAGGGFVARRAPLVRLLRSELRWAFRRPRTLIALGLVALFPIGLGVSTVLVDVPMTTPSGRQSVFAQVAGNALALPVMSLAGMLMMMLPLVCALSAADALAGEAAHGTLRGLLLAPVGRSRLLAMKAFGVGVVALVSATLVSLVGFVTGLIISGGDSLVTMSGTTLSLADALGRVALATLWVVAQLWAVAAIALAVSACTEHPLLVMASVLGGLIVFSLLDALPALDWLRPFLITSSWDSVVDVLRDPVPSDDLVTGLWRALCYVLIGYSLAAARMLTRDG